MITGDGIDPMNADLRKKIEDELFSCVYRTIDRCSDKDTESKPFHKALLPKEVLYWSRFERSFSTSFGQRSIELLSTFAALAGGASIAQRQKETAVSLSVAADRAISAHISHLRSNTLSRAPFWDTDLSDIRSASSTDTVNNIDLDDVIEHRVISDLYWNKDGEDNFLSIKTVKPNIDQTSKAKEDMLRLKLFAPGCNVYFGLYYNPYGDTRQNYKWTQPFSIFDMHNDDVVLIGREYWDLLGGVGFYDKLLEIATHVGKQTIGKIESTYLNPGAS